VNEYAYNWLNQRIKAINDSDADGSLADETPVWFAYDERWRVIAAYEGAADPDEPTEVYIHHHAGRDGLRRKAWDRI